MNLPILTAENALALIRHYQLKLKTKLKQLKFVEKSHLKKHVI
jgi:hypothetical protein